MSITTRLAKAEDGLFEALCWQEAQSMAREFGKPAESLFQELHRLMETYKHHVVEMPNDMVDFEPMIRAVADGEGLDYEELMAESRKALRRFMRRYRR